MPDTSTRPMRLCDICGGLDDHPRHVVDGVKNAAVSTDFLDGLPDGLPARAIAEAVTDNVSVRHLDCCAAAGCVTCQATEKVTGGARGQKLIDKVLAGATRDVEVPEVTDMKEMGIDG